MKWEPRPNGLSSSLGVLRSVPLASMRNMSVWFQIEAIDQHSTSLVHSYHTWCFCYGILYMSHHCFLEWIICLRNFVLNLFIRMVSVFHQGEHREVRNSFRCLFHLVEIRCGYSSMFQV